MKKQTRSLLCLLLAAMLCLLPSLALAAPDDQQTAQAEQTTGQTDNSTDPQEPAQNENVNNENSDNETPNNEENTADPGEQPTTPATEPEEQPGNAENPSADPALNQVKLTLGSKNALVRGISQQIDAAPFATNGTTMLPLRFIAQDILNATVDWDNATNLVKVNRGELSITIDLANSKVWSAGQPYAMSAPPAVIEGRTYVPLRLITELMNCQVQYNAADKSVLISLPPEAEPQPPVAAITYMPATAGQKIEYTDASTDPLGYAITARKWTVTDTQGVSKEGDSLYWLFYQRQGGDYTITYQVQNALGLWSEPVITQYHLDENLPPRITEFTAPVTSVDIGQSLNISYAYENEDWEEITAVSFAYTETNAMNNVLNKVGKPSAFFSPGTHVVTLKVQDAFGQWSEPQELTFEVSENVAATEAQYRFTNLNPGEIFLNLARFNFNGLLAAQTADVKTQDVLLIDSNSPEKVNAPGLLYKDTATGNIALHYHHLNNSQTQLKFYMIAHNETDQPLSFTIGKAGFAGPSSDPMQVGYIENQSYLGATAQNTTVTLQPGEKYLLNPSQTAEVKPTFLQSGLVDITTQGQLTLAVVAMYPGGDWHNYTTLPVHDSTPPQTRGTYQRAAYKIDITLGEEAEKVMLGYPDSFSGRLNSYLLQGTDSLTGQPSENKGNYGMVQTINLTAQKRCGLLINPRGSIYRGAVLFNGELCLLSATGQIQTTQEGVVIGIIEPGETATVTYITPDGSDSPVLLVTIPEDEWQEY